jgi:hypothetical protein
MHGTGGNARRRSVTHREGYSMNRTPWTRRVAAGTLALMLGVGVAACGDSDDDDDGGTDTEETTTTAAEGTDDTTEMEEEVDEMEEEMEEETTPTT